MKGLLDDLDLPRGPLFAFYKKVATHFNSNSLLLANEPYAVVFGNFIVFIVNRNEIRMFKNVEDVLLLLLMIVLI